MVRRDGADLRDHRSGDGLGHLLERNRDRSDRVVDATFDGHGIGAGGDVLRAFAVDRLRQHRGRRRAIAGDIRRLARHFLQHLRAHVFERVFQLDFLRDGDAVLGDRRRTEFPVEDHVASLRPEGHPDRVGQAVDPAKNPLPGGIAVHNLFRHNGSPAAPRSTARARPACYFLCVVPPPSMTASTSSSRRMRYSLPSSLTSWLVYLPKRI